MATFHASVRLTCELAPIPRSTYRFQRDERRDELLRERLTELAQEKPRYGYRRLSVLLRWEGTVVNHKRLFRILSRGRPKRLRMDKAANLLRGTS